jgi:hypothetical protein
VATAWSRDRVRHALEDLACHARLTRDLPGFLRRPISVQEARADVLRRLRRREEQFLAVVGRAIYGTPGSPYLPLLRHAGCELGDLRQMVAQGGVEDALRRLAAAGVYVTYEEFKGRREAIRGSRRFRFDPDRFDNPLVAPHLTAYTGGTRGQPTRVRRSLAFVAEVAASHALVFDAHGLGDAQHAFWLAGPLTWILARAKIGRPVVGWFHPLHPVPRGTRARARYVRMLGRLAGHRFPLPRFYDFERPERMVAWLRDRIRAGQRILLAAPASAVTRVAIMARDQGVGLDGATLYAQGEPFTEARRRHLESSGAGTLVLYGTEEAASVGWGCARPAAADDVHLNQHFHALVERSRTVGGPDGPAVEALLFSSLSLHAPKICLNMESGDYARIEERDCGCALGQLGLRLHLSRIRSFEKLSGEGVTFARSDIDRVMEEMLPARFGGSSLDYQLLEEEAPDGMTRLVLRVSPTVGALDESAVRAALLEALEGFGPVERLHVGLLRRAGTLRVSRERPLATPAGKVLPFHLVRRAGPAAGDG